MSEKVKEVMTPMATEESVTFRCKGDNGEEFDVTVKSGFFKQDPKPDLKKTIQDIIIDHNILPYLHNPVGPAFHNLSNNEKGYFIDGRPLTPEEGAKLQHNVDFGNGVEEVLGIK